MKESSPLPLSTNTKSILFSPNQIAGYRSRDDAFLEKVRSYILEHIDKKGLSVDKLADHVHLSVSQLNRRLNMLINRPAGKLIRELRLRRAARMLAGNTGTISEIAHRSGFSDQAHFCRCFKKLFQCTPSQYRKQHLRINIEAFLTDSFET